MELAQVSTKGAGRRETSSQSHRFPGYGRRAVAAAHEGSVAGPVEDHERPPLRAHQAAASSAPTACGGSQPPQAAGNAPAPARTTPLVMSKDAGNLPLEAAGFPERTTNRLRAAGLGTLADVAVVSAAELLGIRQFGWIALCEVRGRLAAYGLALQGEQPGEPLGPAELRHCPATHPGTGVRCRRPMGRDGYCWFHRPGRAVCGAPTSIGWPCQHPPIPGKRTCPVPLKEAGP